MCWADLARSRHFDLCAGKRAQFRELGFGHHTTDEQRIGIDDSEQYFSYLNVGATNRARFGDDPADRGADQKPLGPGFRAVRGTGCVVLREPRLRGLYACLCGRLRGTSFLEAARRNRSSSEETLGT